MPYESLRVVGNGAREPRPCLGCVLGMEEAVAESIPRLRAVEFEPFYRSAWDEVYRAVWVTFRDADLAREAVDEAMTRAFQHWTKVATYENPAGWVYRVAVNWATNRVRKRQRERIYRSTQRPVSHELSTPTDIGDAVRRLPLAQRQVVVLRLLLDWSVRDTAAALGLREGTVKSRLSRALQYLRKELA